MIINDHKCVRNQYLPYSVITTLHHRYEELDHYFQHRYGDDYGGVEYSRQSESAYFSFVVPSDDGIGDYREIRISNHDPFSGTTSDYYVYLSSFDTWEALKNELTDHIIPSVLKEKQAISV